MNIKGIIFDADGTLVDSMHFWYSCDETYLAQQGVTGIPEIRDVLLGLNYKECCDYFRENFLQDKTTETIMREFDEFAFAFYRDKVMYKPGVIGFLQKMHSQKVPMCIATLAQREHLEASFERLGLDKYINRIFTCTELGTTKHEPDIFRTAQEYLGTQKSETWIFEDSLYSAVTAKKDGFRVCGIKDDSEPCQEELKNISDIYIENYDELLSLF